MNSQIIFKLIFKKCKNIHPTAKKAWEFQGIKAKSIGIKFTRQLQRDKFLMEWDQEARNNQLKWKACKVLINFEKMERLVECNRINWMSNLAKALKPSLQREPGWTTLVGMMLRLMTTRWCWESWGWVMRRRRAIGSSFRLGILFISWMARSGSRVILTQVIWVSAYWPTSISYKAKGVPRRHTMAIKLTTKMLTNLISGCRPTHNPTCHMWLVDVQASSLPSLEFDQSRKATTTPASAISKLHERSDLLVEILATRQGL